MDWFMILFRLIHIVSAIAWAGGAALFFFYVEPTVNKLGPDAEKFMNEMFARKLPLYFILASSFAVFGGAVLYVRDAGGVQVWGGPQGTVITIGALAAIVAWVGGNAFIPSTAIKMQGVLAEIRSAGGPPNAELSGRLHALQERLRRIGMIDLLLLTVAVVAMETARYWNF